MDKKVITERVNDILDEWDPIGANHFQGMRGNEYIMYVPRVIGNYLSGIPTYESLDALQVELIDNSSQEMMVATRHAAHAIDTLLKSCDMAELRRLYT
ncbi:MAG TPA: hypothetical protein VKG92_04590 [Flavobacteriales bacterium]|nr:hypothetical protein [Flavobacteriales bacterium]